MRVRSEGRGNRRSPANVLRVALAHRPPDCRPKEPQVTQNAPNARRPSPQPKATSQGPSWTRRPWGGLGRSQRCTGRVADSDLHCKRQFTRAARRPQRPTLPRRGARSEARGARSGERGAGRPGEEWALRGVCSRFKFALAVPIQTPCSIATSPRSSHATPAGPTLWSPRRLVLRPRPPTRPRPSTRARCACRAALGRRVSNSAPPPSMGHAPIPPDSSISKSTPRDLDFECPAVAFKNRAGKMPSRRAEPIEHDQAQFPARF